MDTKTALIVLADLLLEKIRRRKKILGLLTDKYSLTTSPPKQFVFSRKLKDEELFCNCKDGKHEWCIEPNSILAALNDAANNMSYSNWLTGRLARAAEVVVRYCEEKNIPLQFPYRIEEV